MRREFWWLTFQRVKLLLVNTALFSYIGMYSSKRSGLDQKNVFHRGNAKVHTCRQGYGINRRITQRFVAPSTSFTWPSTIGAQNFFKMGRYLRRIRTLQQFCPVKLNIYLLSRYIPPSKENSEKCLLFLNSIQLTYSNTSKNIQFFLWW